TVLSIQPQSVQGSRCTPLCVGGLKNWPHSAWNPPGLPMIQQELKEPPGDACSSLMTIAELTAWWPHDLISQG
ncbi:hypothetical protein CSPAE12_11352, partial [Colletotrichum incanum]